MSYIEQKINNNGKKILKELEIITQTDNIVPNKKFKAYDIEKANENNRKVGRKGEEFVNIYFMNLVNEGKLLSYTWYNQENESGLPYDFSIQDCSNNVTYLDVKTTGYDFEQEMIFSSQEIDYISKTTNPYCIYRVYKNRSNVYALRICCDCKNISVKISDNTKIYSESLDKLQVGFKGAKLAISPNIDFLNFRNEICV